MTHACSELSVGAPTASSCKDETLPSGSVGVLLEGVVLYSNFSIFVTAGARLASGHPLSRIR